MILLYGLKVEVVDPDEDLDGMFAIGNEGNLVRLSDSKICPYLKGVCKRSRCMAWFDGVCSLFVESSRSPNLVDDIEKEIEKRFGGVS